MNRIAERTSRHFGKRVYPHLFRYCAATAAALEDPQHIGIIVDVLGDDPETIERYYNQASIFSALRKHQTVIADLIGEEYV